MCCFFGPGIERLRVDNTSIFARHVGENEQIIAYEMVLNASNDVVMVLPLPVGSRDEQRAVQFLNLEKCPFLFDRLREMLPVWRSRYGGRGDFDGASIDSLFAKPRLEVQTVGRFEASFVPSIADFDRLDPRFRVAPELWAELGSYADWGFAVFQMREIERGKSRRVHPMAFRFVSRDPRSLFFPTVHVHDGSVHATAKFDHLLFFQREIPHRPKDRLYLDGEIWRYDRHAPYDRQGQVRWNERAENPAELGDAYFTSESSPDNVIDAKLPLQGFGMRGLLPNRDTWLHFKARQQ